MNNDDLTSVNFNSASGMPNTYDYINNASANPTVLLILTVILVVYYTL